MFSYWIGSSSFLFAYFANYAYLSEIFSLNLVQGLLGLRCPLKHLGETPKEDIMRKTLSMVLATLVFVVVGASQAIAMSFQFDSSASYVSETTDPGLVMDWRNIPFSTEEFDLEVGDSYNFVFGSIATTEESINQDDLTALAVTAYFEFILPDELGGTLSGSVQGMSYFWGAVQGWSLEWNNPATLYFGPHDSGMVTIELADLSHFGLFDPDNGFPTYVDIDGIITYSTAPTPEPGTLLLLGAGLGALCFARRRRRDA
ncbi:hypothetical protein DQK91_12280 [Oceanidesulfovibrio marinus]|uniref:Ice-binding protein C-terminal domain-containing protein n=1 Tax=Oceanidesulfovibrio marinus TaxID=370038 RepID=A0A6P1ZGM2_9BACT|nr:hypothetical protein DQK91_12280 [Oceanidesulfovibrio marinus]